MCNSILISPLDRFRGGTGGTGGTAQDFGASRWYRQGTGGTGAGDVAHADRQSFMVVLPVPPAVPPKLCRTARSTTGPTGPTR
jgi:hypothetical protein